MSLKDKYRINELVSFGSKALRKEENGTVLIKKKDGKQVAPKKLTTKEKLLIKEPSLHKKSKISNIPVDVNEKQESFSGEISDRVERAKYNEEELIKAIDTDVDELIKKGDLRAITIYLDRRFGKPTETKDITVNKDLPLFID